MYKKCLAQATSDHDTGDEAARGCTHGHNVSTHLRTAASIRRWLSMRRHLSRSLLNVVRMLAIKSSRRGGNVMEAGTLAKCCGVSGQGTCLAKKPHAASRHRKQMASCHRASKESHRQAGGSALAKNLIKRREVDRTECSDGELGREQAKRACLTTGMR